MSTSAITEEALAELDATGVLASYQSEGAGGRGGDHVSVAETEDALRIAEDVRAREQALAARERQLAQREQQIAVQQRVVEEEARDPRGRPDEERERCPHSARPPHGLTLSVPTLKSPVRTRGAVAAGADTRGVGQEPSMSVRALRVRQSAPSHRPAARLHRRATRRAQAMRSGAAPTSKVFATRASGYRRAA